MVRFEFADVMGIEESLSLSVPKLTQLLNFAKICGLIFSLTKPTRLDSHVAINNWYFFIIKMAKTNDSFRLKNYFLTKIFK